MAQDEYAALRIRIKNKKPVDVTTFTTSLSAFDAQYRKFVQANKLELEGAEYKLYIRAFRNRSIEAELFSAAAQGAMFAANHWDAIVKFSSNIKSVFEYFLGKATEEPDLSKQDKVQIAETLEVIANDHGSNIVINIVNSTISSPVISLNSEQANTIQNQIRRSLNRTPSFGDDIYKQETMILYQARGGTIGAKTGHSAIISRFSERPCKLLFASEDVEKAVLHNEAAPPFDSVFVVDVKVGMVDDNPSNYNILHVHEAYPKDTG